MPKGHYNRQDVDREYKLIPVHENAHRLVKQLHARMIDKKITMKKAAEKSGVGYECIRQWFKLGHLPRLCEFEAVMNSVGINLIGVEDETLFL